MREASVWLGIGDLLPGLILDVRGTPDGSGRALAGSTTASIKVGEICAEPTSHISPQNISAQTGSKLDRGAPTASRSPG